MAVKAKGRPRGPQATADQNTVVALDRALSLLQHLARHPGLTLSDLAEATGQAVATVFRALVTLQAHGMVEVQEPGQLWHVGPGAFRIGAAFLRRTGVVDRARPVLAELAQDTGETASLGVEIGDAVTVLAQAESPQAIRAHFPPGSSAPLHGSAIGKALLAWMPEDQAGERLARAGLGKLTTLTLTSETALLRDLARCRARGFALDDQEGAEGLRSVAAPIFDALGQPVAGLAVSGPAFRLGLSDATRLGAQVRAAADRVTEAIGGAQP
ncbi:IclR family transcriptional regulator [Rhodobacter sp. Har01]|uniref:IclR family transcriptional regulator n=1 Tax=Rhodobacter sp. Har01 TaxID=2883999 RepID=UPI001D08BDA4|nr:IclR family transcriptional regulator [Rhodobacter sp. Har01]MCB6179612.1 IclR family transcriptional regulator [Rhodobacter sp. Har01]